MKLNQHFNLQTEKVISYNNSSIGYDYGKSNGFNYERSKIAKVINISKSTTPIKQNKRINNNEINHRVFNKYISDSDSLRSIDKNDEKIKEFRIRASTTIIQDAMSEQMLIKNKINKLRNKQNSIITNDNKASLTEDIHHKSVLFDSYQNNIISENNSRSSLFNLSRKIPIKVNKNINQKIHKLTKVSNEIDSRVYRQSKANKIFSPLKPSQSSTIAKYYKKIKIRKLPKKEEISPSDTKDSKEEQYNKINFNCLLHLLIKIVNWLNDKNNEITLFSLIDNIQLLLNISSIEPSQLYLIIHKILMKLYCKNKTIMQNYLRNTHFDLFFYNLIKELDDYDFIKYDYYLLSKEEIINIIKKRKKQEKGGTIDLSIPKNNSNSYFNSNSIRLSNSIKTKEKTNKLVFYKKSKIFKKESLAAKIIQKWWKNKFCKLRLKYQSLIKIQSHIRRLIFIKRLYSKLLIEALLSIQFNYYFLYDKKSPIYQAKIDFFNKLANFRDLKKEVKQLDFPENITFRAKKILRSSSFDNLISKVVMIQKATREYLKSKRITLNQNYYRCIEVDDEEYNEEQNKLQSYQFDYYNEYNNTDRLVPQYNNNFYLSLCKLILNGLKHEKSRRLIINMTNHFRSCCIESTIPRFFQSFKQ